MNSFERHIEDVVANIRREEHTQNMLDIESTATAVVDGAEVVLVNPRKPVKGKLIEALVGFSNALHDVTEAVGWVESPGVPDETLR